jgi:hypothetical protein
MDFELFPDSPLVENEIENKSNLQEYQQDLELHLLWPFLFFPREKEGPDGAKVGGIKGNVPGDQQTGLETLPQSKP